MRTQHSLAPLLALLLAASIAHAEATAVPGATTRPADAATLFVAEQRHAIVETLSDTPGQPARAIERLLRLSIENGALTATMLPPDVPDEASVPLAGAEGVVAVRRIRSHTEADLSSLMLQYTRLDAADPARPRATSINLCVDWRGVMLTLNEQTPAFTTTAEVIDRPHVQPDAEEGPIASLRFSHAAAEDAPATQPDETMPADDGRGAYLTAASFGALLDAHHDAVANTMGEALTSLRAMHVLSGLSDEQARQLMTGEAPADADVARGVAGVIDALRADGSAAVEASVAKLSTLGPSAVRAFGAADRKGWSPDLKMSVDTVLAQVASVPASRAQQLLATPGRLVDLLYSPDADVRKAAAVRLERTLGKARLATFDASKDPYAQATLIEAARAALPHAEN